MSTPQPWWALAGVVVGFCLGEGTRYARYRWEIHRNRRLVKEELKAVLAQLPQKREILSKAIASLKQKRTLSTQSVHLIATGYTAVVDQLYAHLTLHERNCLHVIYERLRVADAEMDEFENHFLELIRNEQVDDPWSSYVGRLEDHLRSLETVEELAKSYVTGKPIDVFGVGER
jgi:hypothetical protein